MKKKQPKQTELNPLVTLTVIKRYSDTELKKSFNAGDTIEVTPERAKKLIAAKVAK